MLLLEGFGFSKWPNLSNLGHLKGNMLFDENSGFQAFTETTYRGGSRTAATSRKRSILVVAAVLDPTLHQHNRKELLLR